MELTDILHQFVSNEDVFIPSIIATAFVAAVGFGAVSKTIRGVARERTKREIAAYIAEGSMTPEQGAKLMKSGDKNACS